jgi:hypothetical protein
MPRLSTETNRVCARCGKPFTVIPSRARKGRGRYCGMGCRRPHDDVAGRFWAKVHVGAGCWLWAGAVLHTGYGAFRLNGETTRAHRKAWELANGPVPDGLCVCHRCDVRLCCRPSHLFLGSYADNNADMAGKGRSRNGAGQVFGSRHGMAKLTEDRVREIRRQYALDGGRGAATALAAEFNVSHKTITQVVRRAIWTHV